MSKRHQMISGRLVAVLAALSFLLISYHDHAQRHSNLALDDGGDSGDTFGRDYSGVVEAAELQGTKMTAKLVGWISEQCELMVQEMDAIIRLESVESSERFSLVNYLRYLSLYEQLSTIAKRTDIDRLSWVARKVKVYSRVYNSAIVLVSNYLKDLDSRISQIEAKEKKSQQEAVGEAWVRLYEIGNYIATHVQPGSELAKEALVFLQKSPNGVEDKRRSTRYALYTRMN